MVVNLTNMNLGAPYLAIIQRVIASGEAASATEVVRQALKAYEQHLKGEREPSEEEVRLVRKATEAEMAKWRAAGKPSYSLEQIEAEFGSRKEKSLISRPKHAKT